MFTSAPVIQPPDWSLPFEIMCDASDYVVGVVLGQRKDKKSYIIYYASKTLHSAQMNYTTTEKELLAVVFACDKFIYPVDFIVLDTQPVEACNSFPVILGRPFLTTSNALINCRNGK